MIETIHEKIKSVADLRSLTKDGLEQEANLILYGKRMVLEAAQERQIFRCLYIPRWLNRSLVYVQPKRPKTISPNNPFFLAAICIDCKRPRHYHGGQRCKFCYLLRARMKFYEASQGAAWIEKQSFGGFEGEARVGIQMPVTEWWDDTDIPAYRYIASAQWKDKNSRT